MRNATADTFPKLLAGHAGARPRKIAMRHKDLGIWQSWSWAEINEIVRAYAVGLSALGLKQGDKIAIIGANRPKLYWTIAAAQMLRATPVPVYADAVADEMAHILAHAEVTFAAVQDQEQVDKVLTIAERAPLLKELIYDWERGLRDYDHSRMRSIDSVIEDGRARLRSDPAARATLDALIEAGHADDISIMLYTSGTTGRSKGVMLTAGGCIAAASDTVAFDKLTDADVALAYLPPAWVGDHYLNYAQGMVAGFCTACPESADTAQADLKEIGPSFYFAPPRVLENLLTRVTIRMEDASRLKRWMVKHFLAVAQKHGEKILNGEAVPLGGRIAYGLGRLFVYSPLLNALGFSKVRVAYTAGEAIGPELFSFYRSLGMNLKQLYGQTEAFLYVTAQPDGRIRADTVGPPTPNVEIRIAEDGEVVYRAPGQFVGYYKDAEKTAETMTPDGFVRTGDAGFFLDNGDLKIIDRAKDVGKLTSGALVAPKYIENKLKFFPNVKEAVVFGDGQDFVACFLNIDLTAVGNWAERNSIAYASYQELAQHPRVLEIMAGHVRETNASLAKEPMMAGGQITRFLVLPKELDADDGELTRTQKVRRGFIAERYEPLVRALYDGSTTQDITTEMTFEDGRKGSISARVTLLDAQTVPVPAAPARAVQARQAA